MMYKSPNTQQPQSNKKLVQKILFFSILAVCLGLMVFALVNILSIQGERNAAVDGYDNLRDELRLPELTPPKSGTPAVNQKPGAVKPGEEPFVPPEINQANALEMNSDYTGWLSIPGTNIDYPIVLGANNEIYLNTAFWGDYNAAGTPFMDYRNSGSLTDYHTLIYGHNMKNNTMFSDLNKYFDQAFLDEHNQIYITLLNGETISYTVFAAKRVFSDDYSYAMDFESPEQYSQFATGLGSPTPTKGMLTLSTCTNGADKTERAIVHAVKN